MNWKTFLKTLGFAALGGFVTGFGSFHFGTSAKSALELGVAGAITAVGALFTPKPGNTGSSDTSGK